MKKLLLFSFLLLVSAKIFCQVDVKIAGYTDSWTPMFVNNKQVMMERTEFEGKLLKIVGRDDSSGRIVVELLRIDSNSYFLREYNDGKVSAEGRATMIKQIDATDSVPAFDSIGIIISYLHKQTSVFYKQGAWNEETAPGTAGRAGRYLDNLKEGDWVYYREVIPHYGIQYKTEKYKAGILKKSINENVTGEDEATVGFYISRQWHLQYPFDLYSPAEDSIFLYHVADDTMAMPKHAVTFYPNGTGKIFTRGTHRSTISTFKWKFKKEDRRIVGEMDDDHSFFWIDFLSQNNMVLRFR
jgi:hypothetical protein